MRFSICEVLESKVGIALLTFHVQIVASLLLQILFDPHVLVIQVTERAHHLNVFH